MPGIDVKALQAELKRILKENALELLSGAQEDLEAWGRAIFKLMLRAAKTRSAEAMAHVKAQVALLAEMQRLRANAAVLRTLETVVETLVKVLIGAGRLPP
jgi:hypothetical protein